MTKFCFLGSRGQRVARMRANLRDFGKRSSPYTHVPAGEPISTS